MVTVFLHFISQLHQFIPVHTDYSVLTSLLLFQNLHENIREQEKHRASATIYPPQDPVIGCPQSTSRETLADPLHLKTVPSSTGLRTDVMTGTVLQKRHCSFCLFWKHNKHFLETTETKQPSFLCCGHHCGNY